MQNIQWICHRGIGGDYMENTRKSFQQAVSKGFQILETDLRCTRDGVIVLHHDADMTRTAGIKDKVKDLSYKEFQGIRFKDGQYGMSLLDFMREFSSQSWIFDIKPETGMETIDSLKGLVGTLESYAVRFLMWHPRQERYLTQQFPGAITLANERECIRAGLTILLGLAGFSGVKANRTYAIPPCFCGIPLYKRRIVRAYQEKGARILAYLPEKREQYKLAIELGFDEVLSNGVILDD